MKITSITKEDKGMYQCFVKNEHDSTQGTAELRLGGKYTNSLIEYIISSDIAKNCAQK